MTGRLAVLTPVRNGADDVPDYLKSVERFADLVIALDDGSTDETRAMLEASPIVAETLTNPMRPSFAGWDDAANRQRLLDALAFFDDIEWVFFLDVDERLDEADAAALRRFIEQDAYAGFAYGFEVVRMAGGLDRFDADSGMWVYRMFGYESGLELARTRLHFVPIPVSIDRRRWIRTTVRIQHVGGATQDRRIKRFRKYQEADPDLDYQASYDALLDAPAKVREWSSRLPTTPVVVSNETQFSSAVGELEQTELERPALSAVVISHNDEDTIARSVQALVDQEITDPVEIIVVTSGTDRTADIVEAGFPSVRVIRLPRKAFPGEARNAGLWVARGHYISFPGSHIVVAPGSLQARLEAHEAGWDLVTGTTLNGNPTTAGWASYFLDHSSVMPDRPSGELSTAPAHCSYLRSDLDEVGGFPENMRAGEDTVVNLELFRRGRRAYRSGDAGIVHTSRARTLSQMVRHHFGRGRAWGRILLSRSGSRRKLLQTGLRPMLTAPLTRTRVVARHVTTWGGGLRSEYRRARLHVAAGAVAAAFGTWYQVFVGGPIRADKGPEHQRATGPASPMVVAHQGSSLAPTFGILGHGSSAKAADRLSGHVARQPTATPAPAMYVMAVAATVVPGPDETHTTTLPNDELRAYLAESRRIGGLLFLGIQPGRSSFLKALEGFEGFIDEAGVGVGLQPHFGHPGVDHEPWPRTDIEATLHRLDRIVDRRTIVLIHHTPTLPWPTDWLPGNFEHLDLVGVADVIGPLDTKAAALSDLARRAPGVGIQLHYRRDPEFLEPADLIRRFPDLRIAIYQ